MGQRFRGATSVSLLLLIAFAFQLISILSVPITSKISLCNYNEYQFGVFGYCNQKTGHCTKPGIGYATPTDFKLPSSARKSLANLLIVHVVAAALTLLLCFGAVLTHFHGPASSQRYLLALLVLAVPVFLVSLLAFLVDILLFLNHLAWAGWLVMASIVLIAISGIILGIMRRSLSAKKAMHKRMNAGAAGSELDTFGFSNFSGKPPFQHSVASMSTLEPSTTDYAVNKSPSHEDLLVGTDEPVSNRFSEYQPDVSETSPLNREISAVSDDVSVYSDANRKIVPVGTYLPADATQSRDTVNSSFEPAQNFRRSPFQDMNQGYQGYQGYQPPGQQRSRQPYQGYQPSGHRPPQGFRTPQGYRPPQGHQSQGYRPNRGPRLDYGPSYQPPNGLANNNNISASGPHPANTIRTAPSEEYLTTDEPSKGHNNLRQQYLDNSDDDKDFFT